jgi:signal transduction histidine kinase
MNINRTTIASQLVFLLICSVVVAQIPVILIFLSFGGDIVEDYERQYQVDRIATIYRLIESEQGRNTELILASAQGEELSFSVTETPKSNSPLIDHNYLKWFTKTLVDTEVLSTRVTIGVLDQYYFWFSDEEERCFNQIQKHNLFASCPYVAFSVQLSDGKWLNAVNAVLTNTNVLIVPVLFSAIITLIGFIFVIKFEVRRITAPLRILSQAAERLGKGQEVAPLKPMGSSELTTTAEAFNQMQERLTRFIHDRTHMLAAISHDLRTPITSLRIRVEFVEDEGLKENMIRTLEDMQVMVESCLAFAHQDIVEEESSIENLIALLRDVTSDFQQASFTSPLESCEYQCRAVNFRRALRNIIDNAIKYGKKAEVTLIQNDHCITIEIQDAGPGIPSDQLEDVFMPFFRADKSRNVDSGSVGLGLTIARTIIHKHGGTIEAINTHPGMKMVIKLPLE